MSEGERQTLIQEDQAFQDSNQILPNRNISNSSPQNHQTKSPRTQNDNYNTSPFLVPLQGQNRISQFQDFIIDKNQTNKVKDIEMQNVENGQDSSEDLIGNKEQNFSILAIDKKDNNIGVNKEIIYSRRRSRISFLVQFELIVFILFLTYYYKYGFHRGQYQLKDNETLSFKIENCYFKIHDYRAHVDQDEDLNFYSFNSIPSSIDENILFTYALPNQSDSSSQVNDSNSESGREIEIINPGNTIDCEIVLLIYKPTTISKLEIDCGKSECFIINKSKLLIFNQVKASGQSLEFNTQHLMTDLLIITTFFGQIEINDAYFQQASLDVSTGDISIQSTNSILANLSMVSKLYCASTYSNTPIVSTVADVSPNCTPVYSYSSSPNNQQTLVAQRCFEGSVTVKSAGNEPNQILNAKNTFGNIYINVLKKYGDSAIDNKQTFFDKSIYGQEGNSIKLSDLSLNNLYKQLNETQSSNIYDPIFILKLGSQNTYSSSFTQWQTTFNPAYTYLKPWWIGTLTLSLLTPKQYANKITLAPGFCPYIPSLSQQRIILTQQLLSKTMQEGQSDAKKILTFGWLQNQNLPPVKFSESSVYDGNLQIDFTKTYNDDWLIINLKNDGTVSVDSTSINSDQVLLAAVVVSFVLAFILGLVFMIGIVYAVNQNYLQTLDHINHIDTYYRIQKEQRKTQGREIEFDEIENSDQGNKESKVEKMNNDSSEIKKMSAEIKKKKFSVSGIPNLFYTLIYLSPPLSAYIDQVVLLFYKAGANSATSFFKLLFVQEKQSQESEDQIHNLEKDSISLQDIKSLYEQYCYLNQYLERKLDSKYNINSLKRRGFKISVKQDALVSYYTYIICNNSNNKIIQDSDGKSSLDLFIKYNCNLTKFDSDSIDSLTFEKYYTVNINQNIFNLLSFQISKKEFCSKNHLEQVALNENLLKRDYGIETRFLPKQIIERDPDYDLTKNKKFNINQNRVKKNFDLVLSKDIEKVLNKIGYTDELIDIIRDIYKPQGFILIDFFIVLAHLTITFLVGSPIIALLIYVRIQQTPFLLIPSQRQLQLSDILNNISAVPSKLMCDSLFVNAVAIITFVFWMLSTFDLIYYYLSVSFPQERYFQNYKNASYIRKFISRTMWTVFLIIIYTVLVYLCLIITWLILGAIINPEAFLPYATASSTLVTIVTKKYQQFKQLSEEGCKKLIQYIKNFSEGQFKDIIKKMDISQRIEDSLPTNQIKDLIREAQNNNLLDSKLGQMIKDNIEIIARDPNAVAHLGQEVYDIAQNAQQYSQNLMQKLETKVQDELFQQVSNIKNLKTQKQIYNKKQVNKYLPHLSKSFIQAIQNLLTGQKNRLKQDLPVIFKDIITQYQKGQKIDPNDKFLQFLQILKGPIVSLIFDIAHQSKEEKQDDIKEKLIQNICAVISLTIKSNRNTLNDIKKESESLISFENSNLFEKVIYLNLKLLQYSKKTQQQEYISLIYQIFRDDKLVKASSALKSMDKFKGILRLIIDIIEEKGRVSSIQVYQKMNQFIESIFEENYHLNIQNYFDLFFSCLFSNFEELNNQDFSLKKSICKKILPLQQAKIQNSINKTITEQNEIYGQDLEYGASLFTLYNLWLSGSLFNIPTNYIKEISQIICQDCPNFKIKYLNLTKSNKTSSNQSSFDKKFQNFLNFFDILINDPASDQKIILQNSKKMFGVSKHLVSFIINCTSFKYNNFNHDEECSNQILQSKYFKQISKSMKISSYQLIGLLHLILKKFQSQQALTCLKIIFKQFQIDESWAQLFIYIYNLIASVDEQDLNNSLNAFNFNEQKIAVLVQEENSNQTDIYLDSNSFALILLFLRGKFATPLLKNSRIYDMLSKIFPKIESEKSNSEIDYKQRVKNIQKLKFKTNLNQKGGDMTKINQDLTQSIQKLLKLQAEDNLDANGLIEILNIFDPLGSANKQNTFKKEFQVISKLLSLKNIPLNYPENQTWLLKQQIQSLQTVLSIDEHLIQNFLVLFTSSNISKIVIALRDFDISIEENDYVFIRSQAQFIQNIEVKQKFVKEIQREILDQKLPLNFLQQLILFNQIPSDSETLYFILNSFYDEISDKVQMIINFMYGIKPIDTKQQCLHTYIKNQQKQAGMKKVNGVDTLIKIFNNGSEQNDNLSLFLQYLIENKKKTPLLIGSMFTYLNGDGQQIDINITKRDQDIKDNQKSNNNPYLTIEQYLSKELDIKVEFFNTLQSLFIDDTSTFASELIKFCRQEDYQSQRQQKLQAKVQKNNKVAPENSAINIKNQKPAENFINRITLQDKELEQFIKIFSKNSINSSFFSREMSLPNDLVELIQVVCLIKYSEEENRNKNYQLIEQNKSCKNIFSKLGVDLDEYISCVKFLYNDFDVSNSQDLQNKLKLPINFPIDILQSILDLQIDLPKQDDTKTRKSKLKKIIKQNYFMKNVDEKNLKWYQLLNAIQKDFTLLKEFEADIQMTKSDKGCKDIKFLTGIIGQIINE